jgi:hypothetical protein
VTTSHLLQDLDFPARYELLVDAVGPLVASILQPPSPGTLEVFQKLAVSIQRLKHGLLIPIVAIPGTGKTTLAHGLGGFLPQDFSTTVQYDDPIVTVDGLVDLVQRAAEQSPANEARIRPILIDDREGSMASRAELAAIKRFVRRTPEGKQSLLIWPETDNADADMLAEASQKLMGTSPVKLPVAVEGPERALWQDLATDTLTVVNGVGDLPALGVDPRTYDPNAARSLGTFLEAIAHDFIDLTMQLLRSTRLPLRLTFLFASESIDAGYLSSLVNSTRGGLLDGNALISATSLSTEGKYWAERRGELTRLIYQLDAHAFVLSPAVTIPTLRVYGAQGVQDALDATGVAKRKDVASKALERSDFGRFLKGTGRATGELRGTPPDASLPGFQALTALGLGGAKDKAYNAALLAGVKEFVQKLEPTANNFKSEIMLDFMPIMPDNQFVLNNEQHCLEYAWRAGKFANNGKAKLARYMLGKLMNYSRALGEAGT